MNAPATPLLSVAPGRLNYKYTVRYIPRLPLLRLARGALGFLRIGLPDMPNFTPAEVNTSRLGVTFRALAFIIHLSISCRLLALREGQEELSRTGIIFPTTTTSNGCCLHGLIFISPNNPLRYSWCHERARFTTPVGTSRIPTMHPTTHSPNGPGPQTPISPCLTPITTHGLSVPILNQTCQTITRRPSNSRD